MNVDDKSTCADAAHNEAVADSTDVKRRRHLPVSDESRVKILTKRSPVTRAALPHRGRVSTYEQAVERAKQHIVDGDVFQVVISQRLDIDSPA